MTRRRRVEGAAFAPAVSVPVAAEDLGAYVADFKARFPEDWDALRLCPLQHGLEAMIEKLKG